MYPNYIIHLRNNRDAIGATISTVSDGEGKVVDVTEDGLFVVNFKEQGDKVIEQDSSIVAVVNVEDGKQYMLMDGKVVTIHERHKGSFYFSYAEYTDDPINDSKETIYPNGTAYHFDCGCSVLKEM
jgi:sugar lactone lactonase YvrE